MWRDELYGPESTVLDAIWAQERDEDRRPDVIDGVDTEAACEALEMLMCPWRIGCGVCVSGCREEPACQTSEPEGGWAHQLREAVGDGTREAEPN